MARQFSQDEARRIFARAAERQHSGPTLGEGLTLEELQAIGREAGIDPQHVAAAATEDGESYTPPTWRGVPLRTRRTRRVAGTVSDTEWGRILDLMRDRHQTPGTAEQIGNRRSWTVHEASLQGEIVRVETIPEGTALTVESGQAPEQGVAYGIGSMVGGLALILGLGGVFKGDVEMLWVAAVCALLGIATAIGASISVRRRARSRPAAMDALADRIERLILSDDVATARVSSPVAATEPRLRLDDEDLTPIDMPTSRTRTRS